MSNYCSICMAILNDNGICPNMEMPLHFKTCPYSRDTHNCEVLTRIYHEKDVALADHAKFRAKLEAAKAYIAAKDAMAVAKERFEADTHGRAHIGESDVAVVKAHDLVIETRKAWEAVNGKPE